MSARLGRALLNLTRLGSGWARSVGPGLTVRGHIQPCVTLLDVTVAVGCDLSVGLPEL